MADLEECRLVVDFGKYGDVGLSRLLAGLDRILADLRANPRAEMFLAQEAVEQLSIAVKKTLEAA